MFVSRDFAFQRNKYKNSDSRCHIISRVRWRVQSPIIKHTMLYGSVYVQNASEATSERAVPSVQMNKDPNTKQKA